MAIAGKKALLRGSEEAVAFEDEEFSTEDDQTYLIDDEDKRVWDNTADIIVYEDGVPTTEDFELNRLTGEIIFEDEDEDRGDITADGEYLPLAIIAGAFEFSYSLSAENVESSAFCQEYVSREQTQLDFDASITRFFELDNYFTDLIVEDESECGVVFVLEFFVDKEEVINGDVEGDPDLRAWVRLSTDDISATVDGLVEESVSFEGSYDTDGRVADYL